MKKNNKGVTLVELIVSISILSLVGIGVGTLISQGLRQYRMSNTEVSLQQEAQLVGNQLTNMVIDANDGVSAQAGELNIYEYDLVTKVRKKTVIALDTSNDTLTYTRYERAEGDEDWTLAEGETEELFADYVKIFEVTFYDEDGRQITVSGDAGGKNVHQIGVKVHYELQGKGYDYEQTITMRNQILASNIVDGSFDDETEPERPGTETPGTETPGTETPGTEVPGTETPETEAPEQPQEPKPEVKDITVNVSTSSSKNKRNATVTVILKGTNLPTDELQAQEILGELDVTVSKEEWSWSKWGYTWNDVTDDLSVTKTRPDITSTSYTITYFIEGFSSRSTYRAEAEYDSKSASEEFSFK